MAQQQAQVKFTAVKPQLMVKTPKAVDAVNFYKSAFGAVEAGRSACCPPPTAEQNLPNILCAQLELAGCSFVVYNDGSAPQKIEGIGNQLCLETDDVEAAISKAVSAGAVVEGEVTEGGGACCGGRVGKVKDPYGYVWLICSPSNKCAPVEA
ncbi:uncharacterized protein At5g48480 [Gossypium raimondii]|uniref:VOC domain-containing protein n=1 Tax=Gossypium raimondii TaxID=29730 RepID=A0A0D2QNA8_GOSRA|nr:uncharacterized protein At5g48480 [Gossypium raimondii]KJB08760.1 hypothetical protein B456_001G102200 [Gossypium raimondii]MBA0578657.1 hypothetical protein [Gossypium raimondii]